MLILDEWLIRCLTPNESYNLLEIIEAHMERSMIFCTQYLSEGWYDRINADPNNDSPVYDAIIGRIINNAYDVMIDGEVRFYLRQGAVQSPCSCGSGGIYNFKNKETLNKRLKLKIFQQLPHFINCDFSDAKFIFEDYSKILSYMGGLINL